MMNTLIVTTTFLGFFMTYNASKRAILNEGFFLDVWLQNNSTLSKRIGLILLVMAFFLAIHVHGVGAGFLIQSIILMTVASLVIGITPLRIFNYRHIVIAAVFLVGLEIFIL